MVQIDASQLTTRHLNTQLRQAATGQQPIVLTNPDARHNLAVGLTEQVQLQIRGSVGYFCAGLCDGPTVQITGNAGWALGDNLMNTHIRVAGNAGAVCGVAMRSGEIIVEGNVSSRAGQVMKGGTLICCGDAGLRAGSTMMGGTIIILGNAYDQLGEFMMDGQIYVAGKITSLADDAKQVDIQLEDTQRMGQLLDQHKIKHGGTFIKIISDQRALRYAEYEKGELLFDKKEQLAMAEADTHEGTTATLELELD